MSSVADLRGRRLMVPIYQMSGLVWLRAVLRLYHGIAHDEITWVVAPPAPPGARPNWIVEDAPPGSNVVARPGGNWAELLRDGEVDAVYYPWLSPTAGPDGIRPLLSAAETRDIWAQLRHDTGAVPINHLVGLQRNLPRDRPDVVADLHREFEEAKATAFGRATEAAAGYYLFPEDDAVRQAEQFGQDPFPFGLTANRASLELYTEQMVVEGYLSERPEPEEYLSVSPG
jgi:4,5-dihydroxyphthalate decarboxylase